MSSIDTFIDLHCNFYIQHWINNYKAKVSGRTSIKRAKSKLIRKRSGFNVFASENLLKGN
jgi:hypothetical protein